MSDLGSAVMYSKDTPVKTSREAPVPLRETGKPARGKKAVDDANFESTRMLNEKSDLKTATKIMENI